MDADSVTTGKDFLLKIWQLAIGVPVGIAVIHASAGFHGRARNSVESLAIQF